MPVGLCGMQSQLKSKPDFWHSCCWGVVSKGVLFAREALGLLRRVSQVGSYFPAHWTRNSKRAVPFLALPQDSVDKPCFSVDVLFGDIRWGGRVPCAFEFGDWCRCRCDAVNSDVFDNLDTLDYRGAFRQFEDLVGAFRHMRQFLFVGVMGWF